MIATLLESVAVRAILVAAICNAACALVGCFLVLRRLSLMGDALSHAILPGLVIALLVSHDGGPAAMMVGALAAGLTTTFLTRLTEKHGQVAPDASLGVVYTSLFAFGVVLIKRRLSDIHFDVSCVYEGSLLQVAHDTIAMGGAEVPRALFSAAPVLVVLVVALLVMWKEWKITTFDPALARTMGFAPDAMHYLLMTMVSVTAMVSFESIGSILVIAMLIAPAAAAQLLVDRLSSMLAVSVLLATVATIAGYALADWLDVMPAGCIAVVAGLLYMAAALLGPRYGVLSQLISQTQLAIRVRREDLLARLYRLQEAGTSAAVPLGEAAGLCGGNWLARRAVSQVLRRGEAVADSAGLRLTKLGADEGQRLVRSHRLWEAYLVEEVGLPSDHVHDPAHRIEHFIDESIDQGIVRTLNETTDPHGRQIPEAKPKTD